MVIIINDYVVMNGKVFYLYSRSMTISTIGSGITRTLNATATQDVIARKRNWSLGLEGDLVFYLRIKAVYETGGELSFTDNDGSVYTALWSGDFSPTDESKKEGKEWYSVSFRLEEK